MNESQLLTQLQACLARGDVPEMLRLAQKMVRLYPRNPLGWKSMGLAQQRSGARQAAIDAFMQAIALHPQDPANHNSLGNLMLDAGLQAEAIAHFEKALQLDPGYVLASYNLAEVRRVQGQWALAQQHYQHALTRRPEFAEALCGLGELDAVQNRPDLALLNFQLACELAPLLPRAQLGRANALKSLDKTDEAIVVCQQLLAEHPQNAKAHHLLGTLYYEVGKLQDATQALLQATALPQASAASVWWLAMCQLNQTYCDASYDPTTQTRQHAALAMLEQAFQAGGPHADAGPDCVGLVQPFYLAYRAANNRDVLARYGRLCADIMGRWQKQQGLVAEPPPPRPRKCIGIVSGKIHKHSVWTALVRGWLLHLDPAQFDVHVFYLGTRVDSETEWARQHCAQFITDLQGVASWTRAILDSAPDILLYPEVGMDPYTLKLASMRLAPVQAVSWGHPETTGLPTMDYYLSAELLEGPEAQNHYTEKLIQLPGLGCSYSRQNPPEVALDVRSLGLDPTRPILLCPGYSYKYAPENDVVWMSIAQRLPQAQLVFFINPRKKEFSNILQQRLERKFAAAGITAQGCLHFVPWLDEARFFALMRQATLFLDTIGFSGFNTAMQAVECGLPIVTMEGQFMRGRLAAGVVKKMGTNRFVTSNSDLYIQGTIKLFFDTALYKRNAPNLSHLHNSQHNIIIDMLSINELINELTQLQE